ncbi:MAG: nucleotidyltransferase family protein [Bacteroidota bacterium]
MIKETIILAGGLGTRLRSVVEEQPKSMAPINGKPFLEYLLDFLIKYEIEKVIFSVGYKSNYILNHFANNYKSLSIEYAFEKEPLGTGGAIKNAMQFASGESVLVTNGDSLFLCDLAAQFNFHQKNKADLTLALKPMQNFERYGTVELNDHQRIVQFNEKQPTEKGVINGGVYIFEKSVFTAQPLPVKFSIEKDFFEKYLDRLNFYGYQDDGYFLDIGIPVDYAKAQDEFKRLTY